MRGGRPASRAASRWRALAAPVAIAAYTVAAAIGAALALAPAVLARRALRRPRVAPTAPPDPATAEQEREAREALEG